MKKWPQSIFEFAYIPDVDLKLQDLAKLAESEDWTYKKSESEYPLPVLFSYISYTYKRLIEEDKIVISESGEWACFNTGLVTENQESIFATFSKNKTEDKEPWYFRDWVRKGQWELNKYDQLPEMADYFEDPKCLVLDTRKEIRINVEHIVEENKNRFPEPFASMDSYALQTLLKGAIDNAKERIKRSYKTAIPQYYDGHVQLLLPLCLSNAALADLALVVERHENFYRASTCLTLDMAYNNARQISRPDRDWLKP